MVLFVFHHGAGYSKESFLILERELHSKLDCDTISFDCIGHGDRSQPSLDPYSTQTQLDLSLDNLATDMEQIIKNSQKPLKDIVLVGHSMGGSVVVELALRKKFHVIGVVVLDVVEGSAIDALASMKSILKARPPSFKSLDEAIDYMVNSRQIRNRESAQLSVPSTLKLIEGRYYWRVDLLKTEQFWTTWFQNLSSKFLRVPAAKLLVLANTDRLDKELLIGQMQGKFQLEILESGHCINEDVPEKLSDLLVMFYNRNKPLDLSHIKKVGQV